MKLVMTYTRLTIIAILLSASVLVALAINQVGTAYYQQITWYADEYQSVVVSVATDMEETYGIPVSVGINALDGIFIIPRADSVIPDEKFLGWSAVMGVTVGYVRLGCQENSKLSRFTLTMLYWFANEHQRESIDICTSLLNNQNGFYERGLR